MMKPFRLSPKLALLIAAFMLVSNAGYAINLFPGKSNRFPDTLPDSTNPYFQIALDVSSPTSIANDGFVIPVGTDFFNVITDGNAANFALNCDVLIASASNFEIADQYTSFVTFLKLFDKPIQIIQPGNAAQPYIAHYAVAKPYNRSESTRLIMHNVILSFKNPASGHTYVIFRAYKTDLGFVEKNHFIGENSESAPTGKNLGRFIPNKFYFGVSFPKIFSFSGYRNQFGIKFLDILQCPTEIKVSVFRVSSKSQNPDRGVLVGTIQYQQNSFGPFSTYSISQLSQIENDTNGEAKLVEFSSQNEQAPKLACHTPPDQSDWVYAFQVQYKFNESEVKYSNLNFIDDPSQEFEIKIPQIYFSKNRVSQRDLYIPK